MESRCMRVCYTDPWVAEELCFAEGSRRRVGREPLTHVKYDSVPRNVVYHQLFRKILLCKLTSPLQEPFGLQGKFKRACLAGSLLAGKYLWNLKMKLIDVRG